MRALTRKEHGVELLRDGHLHTVAPGQLKGRTRRRDALGHRGHAGLNLGQRVPAPQLTHSLTKSGVLG